MADTRSSSTITAIGKEVNGKMLPAFTHTEMDSIVPLVKETRVAFISQRTKPMEYRLKQLRKLYWGYVTD